MNQGWELKKLDDVCVVERGSSPRPIKNYITTKPNGVNWIKIGDTEEGGKYIYNTSQKITVEGAKQSRFVKEGDFILTNSMSYGRPYIMKTNGCIHDGWFVFRLKNSIDPDYFYNLLSSDLVQTQFATLASGSVVKNISGDLVKKVVLPIPTISEQRRIVAILDETLGAIDKAKANAEQNLKNAKELFESYLKDVFENRNDGWNVKHLGEVLEKTENVDPTKQPNKEFAYLDVASVNKDTKEIENISYLLGKNAPSRARKLIRKNDIIFATVRPTHSRVAIIPVELDMQVCSTGYFVLRTKPDLNYQFLYYFLLTKSFNKQMEKLQRGASYPAVNDADVKGIIFSYPKLLKNQLEIVTKIDFLSSNFKKLENNYLQKINCLEELKKTILQKAFSGELKGASQ